MARPFWKGSISFGLVEIGVTLRPARAAHGISFSLLDSTDFSPVGYKRYNKRTGREVPWERIVRGYEYEPDQYVTLTDEELKHANVEASQTIELVGFVQKGEIDPIYYETPYFVEPQPRAGRAYELLRATLDTSGLVGIARVVLRTRQHVAALLVHGKLLMLDTLRYSEELRPGESVEDIEEGEREQRPARRGSKRPTVAPRTGKIPSPSPAERRMASMLVEEMRGRWEPERYRDDYRHDVMALVDKKVRAGKTHEVVIEEPAHEARPRQEVADLMSLLVKSLGQRRGPARASRKKAVAPPRREPRQRRRA